MCKLRLTEWFVNNPSIIIIFQENEPSQTQGVISLQIENSIDVLKEQSALQTNNEVLNSTNIQLITGEDGQEMCLVTYALEENTANISQSLEGSIFLQS